jgi:hypothetical protein
VVPVSEWRADPGRVRQPADLYAALASTSASRHHPGCLPAARQKSEPITDPTGPPHTSAGGRPRLPPVGPAPTGLARAPEPDPEESLQRMLVITGLLTAAGLTACLNVTRDIPDVAARLPVPGGRDIQVIIDDDGYIELRFWTDPGTSPSRITTTVTQAISAITVHPGA